MKNTIRLFVALSLLVAPGFLLAEEGPSRSETKQIKKLLWIQNHREIIHNNRKFFSRLVQRLENQKIIGLELIIAEPTTNQIESRWGHSLLRFVDHEGDAGNDLVLGFVGDLDGLTVNNTKGLLGSYPVFPIVKSLRKFNTQYLKDEDRSLDRHILVSNEKMRTQIITHLQSYWDELDLKTEAAFKEAQNKALKRIRKKAKKKWKSSSFEISKVKSELGETIAFQADNKSLKDEGIVEVVSYKPQKISEFGGYSFFKKNCAGALIQMFKSLELPHRWSSGIQARIPVFLDRFFERSLINPFPGIHGLSLMDLKKRLASLLKMQISDFYDETKWPEKSVELINKEFDLTEKMLILDGLYSLPFDVKQKMLETMPSLEERPTYSQMYNLTTAPEVLYQLCQSGECIQSQMQEGFKLWGHRLFINKIKKSSKYFKKLKAFTKRRIVNGWKSVIHYNELLFGLEK